MQEKDNSIIRNQSIGKSILEPEVDILDGIASFIFSLIFVLILLVFDPLQRIAIRFGGKYHQRVVSLLNLLLANCMKLLGTQITVKGMPDLERDQSYIIVSNHQSLFDNPILYNAFSSLQPRFIAKKELAQGIPSISYNLRNGKNAVIDRSNPRNAIKSIKEFAEVVKRESLSVIIFPEGTRAAKGELKSYHSSGLNALLNKLPEAKILGVTIEGSWLYSQGIFKVLPRNQTIHIVCHGPFNSKDFESPKNLTSYLENLTAEDLKRIRGEISGLYE